MIETTKAMELIPAVYAGVCRHCSSEFKAGKKDLTFKHDGRGYTDIEDTTCGVCTIGGVTWKEVLPVRYAEITQERPPSTEYVKRGGFGAIIS